MNEASLDDQRIVVVGGSVAGLATALFIARTGRQVVLLDQDAAVEDPTVGRDGEPRRVTPQAAHSHIFLARLRNLLLERTPDVLAALLDAGAQEIDLVAARRQTAPDLAVETPSTLIALASRRSVLEAVVRQVVLDEPGIEVRAATAVRGLVLDETTTVPTVRGLAICAGSIEGAIETVIPADIVIDASGRRTPFPGWLTEFGVEVPVEVVDCGITYVSRFYRLMAGVDVPPLNRGFTAGASFDRYSCLMFPGDDGTFSITFGILPEDRDLRGLTDPQAFDAAVAAIPSLSWWGDAANATPISGARSMTGLKNRLRRYVADDAPLVRGFVAVGDAASTTNPAHSRGTTLAFVHATAVADAVAGHDSLDDLALRVDQAVSQNLEPWFRDSVEQDAVRLSRWRPDQPAVASTPGRLTNGELYTVAQVEPAAWQYFAELQNLMTTPDTVLTDPKLIAAVRDRLALGVHATPVVAPTHDDLASLISDAARGTLRRRGLMANAGAPLS